jgi:hypothetical protein
LRKKVVSLLILIASWAEAIGREEAAEEEAAEEEAAEEEAAEEAV